MKNRLITPDALRGLAVVMMVLDHTRYFFLDRAFDPFPAAGLKLSIFLLLLNSQLVTSIFILLAGVSAGLSLSKFPTPSDAKRFFLIRGAVIALFELTIVHILWRFNFYPNFVHLEAIFIIGVGIASLGLLQYLPRWALVFLVVGCLVGHNVLDSYQLSGLFWTILKIGGKYQWHGITFSISYPLIPWLPIIWTGFLVSNLLQAKPGLIRLRVLGLVLICTFIFVRVLGLYGDSIKWVHAQSILMSMASFWGTFKYGGSLHHHLWTLGLIFLALSFAFTGVNKSLGFIVNLGRRSLISYSLHLFVLHILALGVFYFLGSDTIWLFSISPRRAMPAEIGFSEFLVVLVFLAVLCITYFVTMLISPNHDGSRKKLCKYL